jgi:nucleoside-diphosphate-sugar epimerase
LVRYGGERILVLGATGFVGPWVARELVHRGACVTLAVRDIDAVSPLLEELGGDTEAIACDAIDGSRMDAVLRRVRPAVTFNLIGYGVDRAERDEALAERINATVPAMICAALATSRDTRWPGASFVHAGSQLEYGPLAVLTEDATPRPDTLYGHTKLEGTMALARAAALTGVPTVTARLFTVYGPGELPGRLLPSLIETAVRGGSLPLTSGAQRLDFVHVEDVAEGLLRLGLSRPAPGEVVNLATGRLTSVREFTLSAAKLLRIEEEQLRFGALPQRPGTMQYDTVDTSKLRRMTGWLPATTVADGILRTIERYGLTYAEE